MNYPSIKTIETKMKVDRETAKKIRRAMMNEERRIYHRMQEIDSLFETYGVEYIADNRDGESYSKSLGVEYCNTGDSYTDTVLYDYSTLRFKIGSWGDMVEKYPKRFGEEGKKSCRES